MYPRLKNLRKERKLSQPQIAELLRITRQQYSLYETGKREIPVHHLKVLSIFYGTSMDYIAGLSNQMNSEKSELKKQKGGGEIWHRSEMCNKVNNIKKEETNEK